MEQIEQNELNVTEVKVWPLRDSLSNLKANVRVVLNGSLVLTGLKVMKGQFGHFLAFPSQSEGSPYKYFDTRSMRLRKRMQSSVLQEYVRAIAVAASH